MKLTNLQSLLVHKPNQLTGGNPHRWKLEFAHGLLAAFLGIGAYLLFSVGNDFPLGFHPDEYLKIHQGQTHRDLFFHPLLLLSVLRALAMGAEGSVETLVHMGRTASAVCGALTVVFGFLFGCRLKGLPGGIATGLFLLSCYQLLTASHYIKEDAYLAVGVMATLWAIAVDNDRRDSLSAGLLGVTAAFAVSAKYVGVLSVVIAIASLTAVSILNLRKDQAWVKAAARFLWFLGALLAVTSIINLPILLNWGGFQEGLAYEMNHVTSDHLGLVPRSISALLVDHLLQQNHVLILALAICALGLFSWKRIWDVPLCALLATGLLYALVLLPASIFEARYLLPVTLSLALLAAFGAVALSERLLAWRPLYAWLTGLIALVALAMNFQTCIVVNDSFVNDSRYMARQWVRKNLPTDARIMQEATVAIPQSLTSIDGRPFTHKVNFQLFYTPYLSLAELQERNIDYYIVSSQGFGRFDEVEVAADEETSIISKTKMQFYRQLFARGELVWAMETDPPTDSFYNPTIFIFKLPKN